MARSLEELRQYLAGEWLFDNDFKDTSGNGNDSVPVDIEWASTLRGLKPRFNGSSSVVDCGDDSSLLLTSEFTISMHVKISINDSVIRGLYSRYFTAATATGYTLLNLYQGKLFARIADGATANTMQGVTDISDNKWHHILFVMNADYLHIYVDGVSDATPVSRTVTPSSDVNELRTLGRYATNYNRVTIGDTSIYSTGFTAAEALALYNATSGEYGVRIAEFSYQHDPAAVIPAQTGEVLRIGGKLAGDAVDTISDRALSNDATIHGAMPTGDGFLAGGRRFDGVDDYLDCGNDSSLDNSSRLCIVSVFIPNTIAATGSWHLIHTKQNVYEFGFFSNDKRLAFKPVNDSDTSFQVSDVSDIDLNVCHIVHGFVDSTTGNVVLYVDGKNVASRSDFSGSVKISTTDVEVGDKCDMKILYSSMCSENLTQGIVNTFFNTLAALPFWSINYRDYPDNVTTYSNRFPHSSSIIASGAFKIDDDKIQCTSAGTLTYSASHEFDGQEYITVTIAGTEYSGTGTITQGNTTVSVAQGSNKITVAMGTGDTIEDILITFRKPVST